MIQRATPEDAAEIASVQVESSRSAYRDLIPVGVLHDGDGSRRAKLWKAWLERSRAHTFVARPDRAVAGFCTLHSLRAESEHDGTGELAAIYVLPAYWRRGIGRLLCERALAEARKLGFSEVTLWVLEPNDRARRFYHTLGFRADGTRRIFHERPDGGLHELRYRLSARGPAG